MSSTITPINSVGKKLKMLVSPFTEFNYHGSSLNPLYLFSTAQLEEMAAVVTGDPFTLDLSLMSPNHPNHEVVVCFTQLTKEDMNNSPLRPSTYTIKQEWFRPGEGTPFFTWGPFSQTLPFCGPGCTFNFTNDFIAWSFVGWVNGEIDQNGDHFVRVTVTGPTNTVVEDYHFTIENGTISTHRRGAGSEGHVWIEGNNLHYIDGEQFEHSIIPASADIIASDPGYFYIDTALGSGFRKARLSWTSDTNRVNHSIPATFSVGNTANFTGYVWTAVTGGGQRGALLFTPETGFGNSRRMDDGNGGT